MECGRHDPPCSRRRMVAAASAERRERCPFARAGGADQAGGVSPVGSVPRVLAACGIARPVRGDQRVADVDISFSSSLFSGYD